MSTCRRSSSRPCSPGCPAAALRPGLTNAAANTAWVIASPDSHHQLVRLAGYDYDQLEDWVRATLSAALLPDG
jgi:hypothetical protein